MTMKNTPSRGWRALAAAAALAAAGFSAPALAAGDAPKVLDKDWSFEGPFGTWDQAELQRGWQVFTEVCSACHGLQYVSFRNLGDPSGPGFPEEQVKAMAAAYPHKIADIDDAGDPVERDALPSDRIPSPYPNKVMAAALNGGAIPPDLSLITKARAGHHGIITQLVEGMGGPEYVYSLMLGYQDEPPEGFEVGVLSYNKYFPGHRIAMGRQLYDDLVEYQDGTPATTEQMSSDVSAFLAWAAEPKMVERKQAGLKNLIFMALFAVLLWYSNKKLWAPIKKGES